MKRKSTKQAVIPTSTAVRIGGPANRIIHEHTRRYPQPYKEAVETIIGEWHSTQQTAGLAAAVIHATQAGADPVESAVKEIAARIKAARKSVRPRKGDAK